MAVPGSANFLLAGAQGYQIERSLRFNSADSAYLSRSLSSTSNVQTFTQSIWLKRSRLVDCYCGPFVFNGGNTQSYRWEFLSDRFRLVSNLESISNYFDIRTARLFRDTSAWYHIVVAMDTTQAAASNRVKIWVNGVQETTFNTANYPSQNFNNVWNASGYTQYISESTLPFDGYMTEINCIDGQALTPSSFGETDTITGAWKPRRYSGNYGANGFYLKFADNSGTTSTTLGKDSSGNGNNWTPNNFSVTAGAGNDSMIDTPTPYADGGNGRGNYCTWNPLRIGGTTTTPHIFSEGNLKLTHNSIGQWQFTQGTIPVSSGKWYYEFTVVTRPTNVHQNYGFGFYEANVFNGGYYGLAGSLTFDVNANSPFVCLDTTHTSYGSIAGSDGDTYMVALDVDNQKFWVGLNGTWMASGNPGAGTNPSLSSIGRRTWVPHVSSYAYGSPLGVFEANFGQRPFAYTPPAGFLALNTQNLPEPTIKKPSNYMDVVTYTGTGSALTPTSSLGFSPDLVWIKSRSAATDHALYDAVRGTEKRLESNNTDAEVTSDSGVTAFSSAGFTLGTLAQVNTNTATYAAWCWDESATPGFDIVTYTGTGVARTIAHSLGVAPSMIIAKCRSTANDWAVYHSANTAAPETDYLLLNSTAATADDDTYWNDTAPTSSVFSIGTNADVNANTDTYVAYLWSEVAGFSKFGSYTGNGSTDGPFVYCGFRPRWVMVKRSDSTSGWHIYDTARSTYNVNTLPLAANLADQESSFTSGFDLDVLSNGFKARAATSIAINTSGSTYIFAAFAESPFKYSLAR